MRLKAVIVMVLAVILTACEDANIQSPVPQAAVYLDIDIERQYPNFRPPTCQSLSFPRYGSVVYERDRLGYGGVVVWIDIEGHYCAADMCCPKCLNPHKPIEVPDNGSLAICPTCGEEFTLITQYGMPTKGICKDILRPFGVYQSSSIVHIRN
ncbi:MAG: hypothetical protein MJZ59_04765 [Paludibacteraceae bacterium]|nr:hypothetical protein [Paludibacteraceae bacterium]